MYLPSIRDARRVATYLIGPYIAVVLTDCESVGVIEYKHVIFVYLPDPHDPEARPQVVLAVASELSSLMKTLLDKQDEARETSYFLGVFPGQGHSNLGASSDWGDLDKFTERGLEVICDHLQLTHKPRRVSDKPDTPTHD